MNFAAVRKPVNVINLRVILVSGMAASDDTFDITKLNAMLREEMQATSLRDAVQTVSQISGKSRKIIYSLAIDLNRENDR